MLNAYVLDTSALFAYTELGSGVDTVGNILESARKGKNNAFISFITLMEIYYITWQERGEDVAKEAITLVKSLPVQCVESNERLTLSTGRLKADYKLSLADAIIAATAIEKSAILVHKDPELQSVSGLVKTLLLPFKTAKK